MTSGRRRWRSLEPPSVQAARCDCTRAEREHDLRAIRYGRLAPQSRPGGRRALLRAVRRGDEAIGKKSMVTPVNDARQHLAAMPFLVVLMATLGDSWQAVLVPTRLERLGPVQARWRLGV